MIPFRHSTLSAVTEAEMLGIYEKIKTPYKYGAVMKLENDLTDSPSVFFFEGRWYMYFISISKDCTVSGYETHLAVSDDLLHWEKIGTIFRRNDENRWDSKQCAGYAAYMDIAWGGTNTVQKVNGQYYISYLAGNSDGYEPDPLFMGLAHGASPITEFTRFPQPILRPDDPDARADETCTLYRSFLFEDAARTTGHRYVNFYNGKAMNQKERIFAAVSDDGEHFERYGDTPVIDDIAMNSNLQISGDPQIVKIDDIYVMFYFQYDPAKGACETFACSRDLIHWTRWHGEPLIQPSESWDDLHAHKPWVILHNSTVYHFYCACSKSGDRFIALATSKPQL
ncbi:MAG: glycosylase [Clostridia bacterium]|nr:glycosylase [Clostridia bacterium]